MLTSKITSNCCQVSIETSLTRVKREENRTKSQRNVEILKAKIVTALKNTRQLLTIIAHVFCNQ